MSQLININDNWIDPNKVLAVVKPGGELGDSEDYFYVHVDMSSWTASYRIPIDEAFGWTVDSAASLINEARSTP